ncbi:hypothetical protein [Kitasatospora sp. GAS1066B]|uniref:hypothetical protein n=1 Tax=Kitasatospora sp. GAS1066B TaxID=3156271 RepID=UPI003511EF7C
MSTPQDPTVELPSGQLSTVELPSGQLPTMELPSGALSTVEPSTVELPAGELSTEELPPAAPRPVDPEVDSATLLDEEVWDTPAATVELPEGTTAEPAATVELPEDEDGLRRFGPGVPSSATAAIPPLAAARWRGVEPPAPTEQSPRRRGSRWLVPVLILLAVLAVLVWQWWPNPLAVTGVSVRTDPAGPACDGTAVVTGTLDTDGGAGTVSYRWRRSDGTVSADLTQPVPKGSRHTDVVLRWTFEGKGAMAATATLEVLSPDPRSAAASFDYSCQ